MDNNAKDFARKILCELEKLNQLLAVGPLGKDDINSQHTNTAADSSSASNSPVIVPTPSPQTKTKSAQPDKKRFPRWRIVQGIGIFAAVSVAVINSCQWRDANRNFGVDNRAWLYVSERTRPDLTVGKPLPTGINLVNGGKTLAREIEADIWIEVVPNGREPDFTIQGFRDIQTTGVIVPNSPDKPFELTAVRYRQNGNGTPHQSEAYPFTASEMEMLGRGDVWMAVHGIVSYRDIFNRKHWTKFCFWSNALEAGTYTARSCTAYNAVDTNQ